MSNICSKCGKNIGLFSKRRMLDNQIICNPCYVSLNEMSDKSNAGTNAKDEWNNYDNIDWTMQSSDEIKTLHAFDTRLQVVRDYVYHHKLGLTSFLIDYNHLVHKVWKEQCREILASNPSSVAGEIEDKSICVICGCNVCMPKGGGEVLPSYFVGFKRQYKNDGMHYMDELFFCKECWQLVFGDYDTKIQEAKIAEMQEYEQSKEAILPDLKRYMANKDEQFIVKAYYLKEYGLSGTYVDAILIDSLHLLERLVAMHKMNQYLNNIQSLGKRVELPSPEELAEYQDPNSQQYEQIVNEMHMLAKLFHKKGIQTDYRKIGFGLIEAAKSTLMDAHNDVLEPVCTVLRKRVSDFANIKEVVYTAYSLPVMRDNSAMSEMLLRWVFEKLGLEHSIDIANLLTEVKENIALEEFEKTLTSSKNVNNVAIVSYENLTGHEFERWLKSLFAKMGYQAIVTKGSGDQGADLILHKEGICYVVQAKKYAGVVSNSAVQEVVASKALYKADKCIVITTGRFTDSAAELAFANGVELWDKNKLDNTIQEINKSCSQLSEVSRTIVIDWNRDTQICTHICWLCGETTNYEFRLEDQGVDESIICSYCGVKINVSANIGEIFICQECGFRGDTREAMLEHKKSCQI